MPLTLTLIMAIINVFAPLLIYVALLSQTPGVRWGAVAASFVMLYFATAYISVCFRKHLLRTLYEDCDPEKFIRCCRKTVEHPLASLKQKRAVNEIRLLYSTGLVAAGSFEEAAGMLNNVMSYMNFQIEDGNDEGAEEYFISSFDKANNTLSRVTAKYDLGCYYARHGEKDKAAQALKYAVENGNKLHISKEAGRLLSELLQNNADIA